MKKRPLIIGALSVATLGVGGVGIATAVTYHSGWPSPAGHVAAPIVHSSNSPEAPAASPSTTTPVASSTGASAATTVPAASSTPTQASTINQPVTTATTQAPITYTVKPGDTLSTIAAWFKLHGYQGLYDANEAVIGDNPNLIFPGQKITISNGVMTVHS